MFLCITVSDIVRFNLMVNDDDMMILSLLWMWALTLEVECPVYVCK